MKLTVSQSKYLLVLGALSEDGDVRIVDIAKELNIKRSSAFNMLNKLQKAGMVLKNENKTVTLTESGKQTASEIRKNVDETVLKLEKYFDIASENAEDCALTVLSYVG
ncbi:MAG: MarR family transcriptional regulator [Clostridiales bacterium]|nr:MarR family transcriptional regulator [Clostridiales bacterium]